MATEIEPLIMPFDPLWVTTSKREYRAVVRQALRAACLEAGVRRITPHALRHTHATLALQRGFTIADVQARLGHADVKTTLGIYGHTTAARDRGIAESFGG